jgi:hypothetical protein
MESLKNKINPIYLMLSGVLTIGIAYGIYYLLTKDRHSPVFSPSKKTARGFCKYSGFPLKYATCGDEVKELQRYLNSKIRPPRVYLKEDGKMGNKTIDALKRIAGLSTVSEAKFQQLKAGLNPFTKSKI